MSGRFDAAPAAVLFDLDGTLIDSAPDLAGACNDMRVERGLEPIAYSRLRSMVGSGARGMVGVGFSVMPGDATFIELRDEFLRRYEARMTRETVVFAEVAPMLARLDEAGLPWGIVTNKASRFAEPLVAAIGLGRTSRTLVCGDTAPRAKPHPDPLFEAARRLGVDPARCIYVGDDLRDVEAGRSAGMATVVAGWGYLGSGETPDAWNADALIATPQDLLPLIGLAA